MKTKTVILTCLLLISITAQADLPQGKWIVIQVTIEKNTDGDVQTAIYNTATEVQSFIPSFKELDIKNTQAIVLRYSDSREETAEYILEGNQLTIMTAVAGKTFQYSTNGGNLTLTTTYNYVNNLPTGYTEHITENWTITLKKQSDL